jgi:quinol monooxygenase YgiN
MTNEFDSDYASVTYVEKDNVVLLVWKKEAHLDHYREPVSFALELLRNHPGSNFVGDARNGFEDDKRDVEWGFTYWLLEMAKTSCKFICFIMNEVNDIEDEMEMWMLEIGKYFAVTRTQNYEEAIKSMYHGVLADVVYVVQDGKRDEFVQALLKEQIAEGSRQEPGNIKYEISLPVDKDNEVCLLEMWTNHLEQEWHKETTHYSKLTELKKKYVKEVRINCYEYNSNL